MAVWLTGPRRHWVVVGSFIPQPILWDCDISSIRVKWILLNLTLASRYHFHPESPLLQMIVCCTRRIRRYSLMFSWDFMASLLQFPSIDKPLWITTYTRHSYNASQLILLLQDTLKFSLLFRESFELTALLFFATWIPLWIISSTHRIFSHPQLIHVFHKSLQNTIWTSKNTQQLIALEVLAYLHYD